MPVRGQPGAPPLPPSPKKKKPPLPSGGAYTAPPILPPPKSPSGGTQPSFSGPPINTLQQYGYNGSIHDFNQRVQDITLAYRSINGHDPSPGLVFDVVRSPVETVDGFKSLFLAAPKSNATGRLQQDVNKEKAANPNEYAIPTNEGGWATPNALVNNIRRTMAQPEPSLLQLSKKYPTIRAGETVPLETVGMDSLSKAIEAIDKFAGDGTIKVTNDSIDLKQLKQLGRKATGALANAPEVQAFAAVTTVRKAQTELNQRMGTNLPVTGIFNNDWNKALSNWFKSPSYFQQAAKFQVDNTPGIDNYQQLVKAVSFKQHAVTKHGELQFFFNAMPTGIFGHGGGVFGIAHGTFDYIVNPQTLGPSTPFHALTRSAGLALNTVGGGITQAKSETIATERFLNAITPLIGAGLTYDQAKARFRKGLHSNPTWLNVLVPELYARHPALREKHLDTFTNLALDLVLLRKVGFTGEYLAPGDGVEAALGKSYLRTASHWSYQDLKAGNIGRATALLEGDSGAAKLSAFSQKLVSDGKMTEEQWTQHVAELTATGKTTIQVGEKEIPLSGQAFIPRSEGTVFHGSPEGNLQGKIDPYYHTKPWQEGIGHYVTEDYRRALKYAAGRTATGERRAAAATEGKVVAYRINPSAKVLKMDSPADHSFWEKVAKREGFSSKEYDQYIRSQVQRGATNKDVREELLFQMRDTLGGEAIYSLEEAMAGEGIQATSHLEGLKTGTPHRVYVVKEPSILTKTEMPEITIPTETVPREYTIENVARPLASLRYKSLPTGGKLTTGTKLSLRRNLDNVDQAIRSSNNPLLPDAAANFLSSVRATIGHAVPGSARHYFEPKLPERVHDLVLKEFKDTKLANDFENRLVRFQATDNVVGIQKLDDELSSLLKKKYPERVATPEIDPFSAVLETEAPSQFRSFEIARQGLREKTALGASQNFVRTLNRNFNKGAVWLSKLIITSPILGWKHVTDYFRRFMAQDKKLSVALDPGVRKGISDIKVLLQSSPRLRRMYEMISRRSRYSETRYMTGNGALLRSPGAENFGTMDAGVMGKANFQAGIGGYLRRRVDSDALAAYRKSSENDLGPLVDLIKTNKEFNGIYHSIRKSSKVAVEDPGMSMEDHAQLIWNQYQEIEDAAVAAGEPDFLVRAQQILEKHSGRDTGDRALGKYVQEARVDFKVRKAQVEERFGFDSLSNKAIGLIMTANKWNRSQLFEQQTAKMFSELKATGASDEDALRTAMSGAEKLVTYHMLDFANRLQVEQDLRWVSFFATKHRLYWKWLLSTFVRQPGAAALVYDFRKVLDGNGNINFTIPYTIPGVGDKLQIPAARLTWVPARDYSEISPPAAAVWGVLHGKNLYKSASGTFGNVFTRNDNVIRMGIRLGRMETGSLPKTYTTATAGMDSKVRARMFKTMNDYANQYYEDHGTYPSEAQTVVHTMWHSMGEEAWRANLPLPVQTQYTQNPGQKLLKDYLAITAPQKRHAFLDAHPELQTYFGIYKNPEVYQHNREYWRSFTSTLDHYRHAKRAIWQEAQTQGYWTPELNKRSKEAGKLYGATLNKMILQDAAQTGKITDRGRKLLQNPKTDFSAIDTNSTDLIQKKGFWGTQIEPDPLVNPYGAYHRLFPKIPSKDLQKAVVGYNVKSAREELARLKTDYAKQVYGTDPEAQSEIKTNIRRLIQYISDFQNYPTNPVSKALDQYQNKYANPFWKTYEKKFQAIQGMPKVKKDVAYAEFRAWRDAQDHEVVIDGVKFPSPIKSAWANLDPMTRKQNLSKLASSDWGHLANYEKQLLTDKAPPKGVSEAWAQFDNVIAQYRVQYPGARIKAEQKLALVKQMNGYYPGFLKDYQFSLQNKERRFEATTLYQDMSKPMKSKYDKYIGSLAAVEQKRLSDAGYSKSEASGIWRNYIDQQVVPWLNDPENTGLKRELSYYGPDFLYSLVN